jgi:hypothetical protein
MTSTAKERKLPPDGAPYFTVPETATQARTSDRQIWTWALDGDRETGIKLRSIKIGRLRRIPAGALEEFIAAIADHKPAA